MQDRLRCGAPGAIFILIIVLFISCVPSKKLKYFADIDEIQEPVVNPREERLIMISDKIDIRVLSIDEKTNQLINSNNDLQFGYFVDKEGNIHYPFIGKININGLTLEQAGLKLGKALSEYVSEAYVSVNFIDSNVTVMGQVQNQGIHPFNKDKLNIYEALALAGGISQYGNRKNVVLIRQEGDKIMYHKLDLSDSRISGKEYYYIHANDIIVVEPLKTATWYNFNSISFSTILSSITSLLFIYTLFLQRKI